jgi:hypothetical protein
MNNPLAHIVQRVRAEYLEMPGLALRPEQIERLCGVDTALCESVLTTLVESGFLSRRADGAYGRHRNPDIARLRLAKASLEPSVHGALSLGTARAS